MNKLLCVIVISLLVSGCGFGSGAKKGRIHRGAVSSLAGLCDERVKEAIAFGQKHNSEPDVIDYAFMQARDLPSLPNNPRTAYILVSTNYYLLAQYAAKQARENKLLDEDFVDFLSTLPALRVEAMIRIVPDGDMRYAKEVTPKFVLFKDATKVNEFSDNPLHKGRSPYYSSRFSTVSGAMQETYLAATKKLLEATSSYLGPDDPEEALALSSSPQPEHLYGYTDIDEDAQYSIVFIYADDADMVSLDLSDIK